MAIQPNSITERWNQIRNNKDCDLSLDEESVASYLAKPESELVQARILETLIQLGSYRVNNRNGFTSKEPDSPGPMATCEGLEAFFVPAVEGAMPFSTFLAEFERKSKDKQRLVELLRADIKGLLESWGKGEFPGDPYAKTDPLRMAIEPEIRDAEFKDINITEAAALACRVVIHLLTLKLNRPDEKLFQQEIGDHLVNAELFGALSSAIDFLIKSFQRGKTDSEKEDEAIVNATVGKWPGSGWSWTDRQGLPPMLFFTAAAVDGFAELDLYLIRAALSGDLKGDGKILENFYDGSSEFSEYKIKSKLIRLQLCVDMARRWIQKAVLPRLIEGFGQYPETFPEGRSTTAEKLEVERPQLDYEQYKDDLARVEKTLQWPTVYYNSLYALLVMLWSWGDWADDGRHTDDDAKSAINRALAQLVYNYGSIAVIREILNKYPYVFYLPGQGIFKPADMDKDGHKHLDEGRKYLDAGFLPLFTRLLVLFVVYGVGDRNLLEPVIRDLYVDLLQNRHRRRVEYGALWSAEAIEMFSTQRALQALTFYFAYARGKEKVEGKGALNEIITLRNKTGFPLILEAVAEGRPSVAVAGVGAAPIDAANFQEYCRDRNRAWQPATQFSGENTGAVLNSIIDKGTEVITACQNGTITDVGAARLILNSLMELATMPESPEGPRMSELQLIERQVTDLKARTAMELNR